MTKYVLSFENTSPFLPRLLVLRSSPLNLEMNRICRIETVNTLLALGCFSLVCLGCCAFFFVGGRPHREDAPHTLYGNRAAARLGLGRAADALADAEVRSRLHDVLD